MNNDSNFEQQFTQNVKASVAQPTLEPQPLRTQSNAKTPLIVMIILALTLLTESIVLTIVSTNYFSMVNAGYEEEDATVVDEIADNAYVYNSENKLIALGLACTVSDGASYVLTTDGKYQQFDNTNSMVNFGTYTIVNNSLIALNDSSSVGRVLYYDGFDLADGLTIYGCVENVSESTGSNAN